MSIYKDSTSENLAIDIGEEKRPPLLFLLLVAGLGFSAYFTGAKLIPSIANNIGPFEFLSMGLFLVAFVYFLRNRLRIEFHFTIHMLVLITIVAVLSLPNLADRIEWGGVQFALLVYTTLLVLVLFNVLLQFPSLIRLLLRFAALGGFVAGSWIIFEGISTQASIGTAGPFRNRSHVGIYMGSAFWLALLYFFWPGMTKGDRIFAIVVIFVSLYGVAVAGRRSVYLSLFIGFGILAISFIFVSGKGRFSLPVAISLAAGVLFLLAQFGSQYIPQLNFFNERVFEIDNRLRLAVGTGDEIEDSDNFIVLQRQGMFEAVADHPLLGIGWGGFFESEYSPTGHEMHSTPQRFLTELGIIGFSIYMIYNLYLWVGSLRLFIRLRKTKYQIPALVFMVSIWSLSISWAYNRSVTERTYWLLIVMFIALDALANTKLAKQKKTAVQNKSRQTGYYPPPEGHSAPPVLPLSRK